MAALPPFILTLTLDPEAQADFDAVRSAHFPRTRLLVGAHVTLFHALPNDADIAPAIKVQASNTAAFPVSVSGLRFLGRGVAFVLDSARLHQVRAHLRQLWAPRLTPQDRQPWRPHVTIQNKVEPAVAKALHAELASAFVPYMITATGLTLWRYRNGPWDPAGQFPFAARRPD
jgi:2'-5' RNA ligase